MRRLFVGVVLASFLLVFPAETKAAEKATFLGMNHRQWRNLKDVSQGLINLGMGEVKAAIFKGMDIAVNYLGDKQAELNAEEISELKSAIRAMQLRCEEIPEIRQDLSKLRSKISDLEGKKADRREVVEMIRNAKLDMEEQVIRLDKKIDKTQAQVDFLAGRLDEVSSDLAKVTTEVKGIKREVGGLKAWAGHTEYRLDRIEDRIAKLESIVGVIGSEAVDLHRKAENAKALERINIAVERDPGGPGYHYVKAMILKDLGRNEEAEAAVRTGAAAETTRLFIGQWFKYSMERIQGPTRIWMEDMRTKFLAKQ